jgi:hypothetical protein
MFLPVVSIRQLLEGTIALIGGANIVMQYLGSNQVSLTYILLEIRILILISRVIYATGFYI